MVVLHRTVKNNKDEVAFFGEDRYNNNNNNNFILISKDAKTIKSGCTTYLSR
jgi:hypothetical protein